MLSPSHAELSDYLNNARQARGAVSLHKQTASPILTNPAHCQEGEANQLAKITSRPPSGTIIYKYGSRSFVGSFQLTSGSSVALKYYYPKSLFKKANYALRGSRCEQSWLGSIGLLFIGIPTPQPLAMVEKKNFGGLLNQQSFLATRTTKGIPLHQFHRENRDNTELLTKVRSALKNAFDKMAEYKIAHGDLKATNILIDKEGSINFIDLDAVRFLIPDNKWDIARQRDKKIFLDNWREDPAAAAFFNDVIS